MSGVAGHEPAAVRLERALADVRDPELSFLTIGELGVLRGGAVAGDGWAEVRISPTYSGCPALETIRADIRAAVRAAGLPGARISTVLSPAWSPAMLTDTAREKLERAGIAVPAQCTEHSRATPHRTWLAPPGIPPRCPLCQGTSTRRLSRFGATLCREPWQCTECGEPFDYLKEL